LITTLTQTHREHRRDANEDHRPGLKHLLFVLTVSADGAVPVHARVLDGNTEDSTTHIAPRESCASS